MANGHQPDSASLDATLVVRVQQGDPSAYAAIFLAYYSPIVRFLTRYLGPGDNAEDIAQDVFAHLWEHRHRIDPNRTLKAYLFTMARNRAFDLLAHRTVVQRHEETARLTSDDTLTTSPAPSPDEMLTAEELIRIAEERVATLSPRLREVYHLSRDEGLSTAEIAAVLGTSVQTVYTQLTRITQELHPVLREWLEE